MPLVAHYPLQEDSGSTAHDIVNGNDGTINGATVNQTGPLGGSAYSFDGTDDYVNLTGNGFPNFDAVSYGAWVNADSSDTSDRNFVIRLTENNDTSIQQFKGDWRFQIYGNNSPQIANGSSVPTDSWVHIFGTWDGSNMTLYVNGTKDATATVEDMDNPGREAHIGADGNSPAGRFWNGRIADMRLYDHALSPQEVSYLYEQATSPARARFASKVS